MTRVLLMVGPATGGMGGHVESLARGLPALGCRITVFTSPSTAARFWPPTPNLPRDHAILPTSLPRDHARPHAPQDRAEVHDHGGEEGRAEVHDHGGEEGRAEVHDHGGEEGAGGEVVAGWPGGRSPGQVVAAVRVLRRMFAVVDVVHAHGHQAGLVAVVVARTMRRRARPIVVISWHNAVLGSGLQRRLLAGAELVQARGADLITGASADLVDRARALGAGGAELAEVAADRVIPSRADETAADPLLASLIPTDRGEHDGPIVLTVSRIAPQKRLDVLLVAAARLGKQVPDLRWLVAGDGDPGLLIELEGTRDALAAPVTFLGARRDVPALMAAADVFALTSAWEARPLVIQEAMAAGLPVVATEVGGVPELLGGTGVLVPPGDPQALADAVGRLIANPAVAADLARAAKQRFAGFPTQDDVVAAWTRRYLALTASGQ